MADGDAVALGQQFLDIAIGQPIAQAGTSGPRPRSPPAGTGSQQTPSPCYISVKTVEFYLGHIFAKLGIQSGNDLITRNSAPQTRPDHNQGET